MAYYAHQSAPARRAGADAALTSRAFKDIDITMTARILVIDDESRVTSALRRVLTYEGYQVVTAASGEGGLEMARLKPPDLVVLDIMLPGINGLEVCRRLRDAGDEVAILMLTARDAVTDRVRGLEIGADDYLVKPFA